MTIKLRREVSEEVDREVVDKMSVLGESMRWVYEVG